MRGKFNTYRIVILLLFALYSFILFMCEPFYDHLTLWMCYGFVILGFAATMILSFIGSAHQGTIGMKGALFVIATAYLSLEILISIILVSIANAVPVLIGIKVHLWIQIPLLILFVILFFVLYRGNERINQNIEAREVRSEQIRRISLRIKTYNAVSRSVKVKDRLDSLVIAIRTFDLGIHPELSDIEYELEMAINALNEDLSSSKTDEEVLLEISKIDQIILARKELTKVLKRG